MKAIIKGNKQPRGRKEKKYEIFELRFQIKLGDSQQYGA